MSNTVLEVEGSTSPAGAPQADRRAPLTAVAAVALPTLVLAVTAVLRYLNGKASIDLVVFDQGLWSLSRGHSPMASVIGETLLEDHFGPGILGLSLLYRLVATPVWLLVGQAAAAGAAAWVVVRRLEGSLGPGRAGLLGAALLVSPPVAYAVLFDVHAVVFAVPFALAAVFSLEDGRHRRALVLGLVAALFRAEAGLAVLVAFAVWPNWTRARLRPAALLGGYLVAAMYLDRALGHDSYWTIHFSHLGASPIQAILHPGPLVSTLFSGATVAKVFPWLAAGGFLALKRPRLALPAAVLSLPVVLSDWGGTAGVVFQYGFAPAFLLALAWIPTIRRRPGHYRAAVAGCLTLAALLGPFTPGLLPSADGRQGLLSQYWTGGTGVNCIIQGIPAGAGVSGSRAITLLAHRQSLYLWPFPFAGAPSSVLPADHLSRGDVSLAATVDYLVIPSDDAARVPAGFVPDGRADALLRYRRQGTTTANPPDCGANPG